MKHIVYCKDAHREKVPSNKTEALRKSVNMYIWTISILRQLFIRDSSTLNPSRPDPGRREKVNLNFYFHTSLWWLKRFYEGLKPFEAPQRSVKVKFKLIFILLQLSKMHGAGRVKFFYSSTLTTIKFFKKHWQKSINRDKSILYSPFSLS